MEVETEDITIPEGPVPSTTGKATLFSSGEPITRLSRKKVEPVVEGPPEFDIANQGRTVQDNVRLQSVRGKALQERVRTIDEKRTAQAADDLFSSIEQRLDAAGTDPLHADAVAGQAGLHDLTKLIDPILEGLEKHTTTQKGGAPVTTGARFRGRKGDSSKRKRKSTRRTGR